jgi:hypothetical protein
VLHVVGVLQHWGRDVKPGREVPLRVESDLVIFRKFTVRIRPFWMLFTLFIKRYDTYTDPVQISGYLHRAYWLFTQGSLIICTGIIHG